MTIEHQFPVETLTHVLKLLDIPSRVKLASCNLTLQQRVYRECFGAWISIDFSLPTHSVRLGDLDLSRLLTRVNARLVTKDFDLKSCSNVRGTGLAPLRSSRVLETGFLPEYPFDPTIIFWTLQTCIPYKLSDVSMNEYGKEYKADVTIKGLLELSRVAFRVATVAIL
jgi:hypothetical protein